MIVKSIIRTLLCLILSAFFILLWVDTHRDSVYIYQLDYHKKLKTVIAGEYLDFLEKEYKTSMLSAQHMALWKSETTRKEMSQKFAARLRDMHTPLPIWELFGKTLEQRRALSNRWKLLLALFPLLYMFKFFWGSPVRFICCIVIMSTLSIVLSRIYWPEMREDTSYTQYLSADFSEPTEILEDENWFSFCEGLSIAKITLPLDNYRYSSQEPGVAVITAIDILRHNTVF